MLAAEALVRAQDRPSQARRLAAEALAAADREHDEEASSVACRAMGLVAREMRELTEARRWLDRSAAIARRAGLRQREGEALMTLALTHAYAGSTAPALRAADRAAGLVRGRAAVHLHLQRAIIEQRLGRLAAADAGYRKALAGARRYDDRAIEGEILNNRAILRAWRGDLAGAEADLALAIERFEATGRGYMAAVAAHNRGWVAGRRGDVPAALAAFDAAEVALQAEGSAIGDLLLDRGELLLSVRLASEARAVAARAVSLLERDGAGADLAEGLLLSSHAALLDGDPSAALADARRARRSFVRSKRPAFASLARFAEVRALVAIDGASPRVQRAVVDAAAALEDVGFAVPAADARLLAGHVAHALGRHAEARLQFEAARAGRSRGPVDLRVRAWHADALLHLEDGRTGAALRSLRRATELLDEHRSLVGATELRAHLSGHGEAVAATGMAVAIASADPDAVLEWSERGRAQALLVPPARPPDDAGLAADLAALRAAVVDLDAAVVEGRPTGPLLRRQAELEARVRDRARRASGRKDRGSTALDLPPAAVSFVESEGRVHAVVIEGRRRTLVEVGDVERIAAERDALAFALRRLAVGRVPEAALAAARTGVDVASRHLDEVLSRVVPSGEQPVVLVPSPALHGVAWAALPSLRDRPFSVTPSLAVWSRSTRANAADGPVVVVAGPGLESAPAEARSVAARHRGVRRLVGERATAARVMAAMDGARLAHLACHGRFRADNPLFSSLELADGPLFVHDLERLRQPPAAVVLSACDVGDATTLAGGEVLGLAAGLLGIGVGAVVASSIPVPDRAAAAFMVRFHRALARGASVAASLAAARSSSEADDLAAAAFAAYGAAG